MIISRVIAFVIRLLEFANALLVTSLAAWFLNVRHTHSIGPEGRLTFSVTVGITSIVLSIVWLIPFTWTFLHYPLDFIMSFGYFTIFAVTQEWIYHVGGCGRVFNWNGVYQFSACQEWRTMIAFAFIGGVLWLISGVLSIYVFHIGRNKHNGHHSRNTVEGA